jgi:membrane protease subunit HflK
MKENRAFFETIDDLMKLLKVLMVVVFIFYAFSGITIVKPGEVAMIVRFGRLVGISPADQLHHAGWLFALPYPIDEIIRAPEKEILEVKINELAPLTSGEEEAKDTLDPVSEGYCISGDQNIFQVRASVKFQVVDPVRLIFHFYRDFATMSRLLNDIIVQELTRVSAGFTIDGILTESKEKLASMVRENAQKTLDRLDCGILLLTVEFAEITPPRYLEADFEQVNSAYIQRQNFISEATTKREELLPKSRADADRTVSEAYVYREKVVSDAQAHATGFLKGLSAYKSNPTQIRIDLLQETQQKVFANMHNLILFPEISKCPAAITTILENTRGTSLPVDYQELYSEEDY